MPGALLIDQADRIPDVQRCNGGRFGLGEGDLLEKKGISHVIRLLLFSWTH
jgi:hypothetical protein